MAEVYVVQYSALETGQTASFEYEWRALRFADRIVFGAGFYRADVFHDTGPDPTEPIYTAEREPKPEDDGGS